GGETVHGGHPHVHQHHVHRVGGEQPERLGAIAGLEDHVHVRLGVDHQREPGPDELLVVHQGDPVLCGGGGRVCGHGRCGSSCSGLLGGWPGSVCHPGAGPDPAAGDVSGEVGGAVGGPAEAPGVVSGWPGPPGPTVFGGRSGCGCNGGVAGPPGTGPVCPGAGACGAPAGIGISARTRYPPPVLGPAASVPPSIVARSRIPSSPCPAPSELAAAPRPSSSTCSTRLPGVHCTSAVALAPGPACLRMFVSDSWAIR